jgi:hypothetical protein
MSLEARWRVGGNMGERGEVLHGMDPCVGGAGLAQFGQGDEAVQAGLGGRMVKYWYDGRRPRPSWRY